MPAAAVIRRVQALPGVIGRKGFRRRLVASSFKAWSLTPEREKRWTGLKYFGATGTIGVGVKSVDIDRNSKGEGG